MDSGCGSGVCGGSGGCGGGGGRGGGGDLRDNRNLRYWILLIISYIILVVGSISSSLLSRFYFIHGGSSRWVSTWVQSAGFPLLLIPIYLPTLLPSIFSKNNTSSSNLSPQLPFSLFTPKILLSSLGIGLMLGVNNFLFSWGVSYLPVSTASLVLSTQLAFNLILSVIIVKQKITFSNFNCVLLLTISSVLLALSSSHDRPAGVSKTHYFLGFFSILGAGLLFALYLPIMQMVYRNVHTYQMMIEMQFVMELAATIFATIGMASDGGFTDMKRESNEVLKIFDLGKSSYSMTLGFTIVTWQMCFLGTAGLVFLTTSLNGGICMTALLPMNVLGGVIAFRDSFGVPKGISTVLCIWGFCSYLYGEYMKIKKEKKKQKEEMKVVNEDHGDDDQVQMSTVVVTENIITDTV